MESVFFALSIEGLTVDTFVVKKYKGTENLSTQQFSTKKECHGFLYNIQLASRRFDIQPHEVIDKNATLTLYIKGEKSKVVHGIVRDFSRGDIDHHTDYSLTLVPAIERLSLRQNSRLFQHQSVSDIIATLFQEMGINDYVFLLKRDCPPRELCVQYRETDLDFIHRLAAEEGLVYRFEHYQNKHTIVLSDDTQTCPTLPKPIIYNNSSSSRVPDVPYISNLEQHIQSDVSEVTLQDYSFKKPSYSFQQEQYAKEIDHQQKGYQYFDAPGRYKDSESGKAFSRYRLEYLRRKDHIATGQSNHTSIQAGIKFLLADHLDSKLQRKWLVISVTHQGEQPQALEEEGSRGAATYHNQTSSGWPNDRYCCRTRRRSDFL